MADRDTFLKEFRGETLGTVSAQSSADELFQNQTIRPILKLQNDLFIAVFINYVNKNKADFYSYTVEKKLQTIENSIQKDIGLDFDDSIQFIAANQLGTYIVTYDKDFSHTSLQTKTPEEVLDALAKA